MLLWEKLLVVVVVGLERYVYELEGAEDEDGCEELWVMLWTLVS